MPHQQNSVTKRNTIAAVSGDSRRNYNAKSHELNCQNQLLVNELCVSSQTATSGLYHQPQHVHAAVYHKDHLYTDAIHYPIHCANLNGNNTINNINTYNSHNNNINNIKRPLSNYSDTEQR